MTTTAERTVPVNELTIDQAVVSIRVVRVGSKAMTIALYEQIPWAISDHCLDFMWSRCGYLPTIDEIREDSTPYYGVLGRVERCLRSLSNTCVRDPNRHTHTHVLYSESGQLRACVVPMGRDKTQIQAWGVWRRRVPQIYIAV